MLMLNMILNGFAHSLSHVVHGNTLTEPFHKSEKDPNGLRKFDYIVSNPPFKLDFSDYHADLKADPYKGRFFAGIPNIPNKDKKGMEIYLCFFQHLLYSLKDEGKAAIVVPTGFITSKTGIAKKIIQHIVDNGWCGGVVSMPSNIFANTGTNVSVVIIDKTKRHNETVLIDASKLGEDYQEGNLKKHRLSPKEVSYIVDTFRNRNKVDDFSVVLTPEEIKEKNYSLSAGQYFDIKIEYVDITEDAFNSKVANYETVLKKQFEESKALESQILSSLKTLLFNEH
jgi:type I restriction enzyme M protein